MSPRSLHSSLALRKISLFEGLTSERLKLLAQSCRWSSVAARKPLLSRSLDEGDVYFLVSGRACITTYSVNGRQVTFRDCAEGEIFGDIAAIDGGPRSADVLTLEACVIASLDRLAFMALVRDEPSVAERLMLRLVALVRRLSERVIDLSTLSVQSRVHVELLRMAHSAGIADNQARLEPAPRHAALASHISTNREQVTRELNNLLREGLLVKDGQALIVTDTKRLTDIVVQLRGETR